MCQYVGLWLLLLLSQQGAVAHELGHDSEWHAVAARAIQDRAADLPCALCPAFAQVISPTLSHAFAAPVLGRSAGGLTVAPLIAALDAAVPRPRSRGPPSNS